LSINYNNANIFKDTFVMESSVGTDSMVINSDTIYNILLNGNCIENIGSGVLETGEYVKNKKEGIWYRIDTFIPPQVILQKMMYQSDTIVSKEIFDSTFCIAKNRNLIKGKWYIYSTRKKENIYLAYRNNIFVPNYGASSGLLIANDSICAFRSPHECIEGFDINRLNNLQTYFIKNRNIISSKYFDLKIRFATSNYMVLEEIDIR
jgi:hypothetical protein